MNEFELNSEELQDMILSLENSQKKSILSEIEIARRIGKLLKSGKEDDDEPNLLDVLSSAVDIGVDDIPVHAILNERVKHIAHVNSLNPGWHASYILQANRSYKVTPSKTSLWTINVNSRRGSLGYRRRWEGIEEDYHMAQYRHPSVIPTLETSGFSKIHLGLVYALIWQHQPNGTAKAIFEAVRYEGFKFIASPHGASIHFVIADTDSRGDNAGICKVTIEET